jgi:ATP-binding cassette, subfamily B, bacterial
VKKSLAYGFKALSLSWKANGVSSIIFIIGAVYDSTLYPLLQVFLLARAIDLFSSGQVIALPDLYWIIIAYLLASVVKLTLKSISDVKEANLQVKFEGYLDLQVSKKLTELDPATFENPEFQNLLAQIGGVTGSLQAHLMRFVGLINAVFKFVTAAIVVSVTFPLFAPIILIATIPIYIAYDRFRISTWPFYVEKKSLLTRVTQYIKTLLSSDSTSKESIIFKTGDTLLSKIEKHQQNYYQDFDKANNPWTIKILLAKFIQFGAFIYTQYLNLSRVLSGTLSIGNFALIFQQSLNLTLGAEEILSMYSSMSARNKYIDKYFEFMNTPKFVTSPEKSLVIPQTPLPPVIEFKNVAFKYPGTKRSILRKFNLTINPGEKIALVGENGAGKTTIIKLLLRFYDVTEGEILINGVNIKEISLDGWHKLVGALFQDFIKYQFTFKENVYIGDLSKSNDEKLLREAISKSGASAYVSKLPDGINQVVGKMFEKGIDLSGGQWQKLALARAFFRDAPLLILDEPTSAIDAKAEYEIFQNVQKLQKDKTVIIISHRFSTVRNADRILVLHGGRVIEEGDHKKLMDKNGLYAELFELQARGYK